MGCASPPSLSLACTYTHNTQMVFTMSNFALLIETIFSQARWQITNQMKSKSSLMRQPAHGRKERRPALFSSCKTLSRAWHFFIKA
ncbi:hypothetical protein KP509_06G078400 [Ceratopteris richardii]|uniref:Uncharacterized protein n=1 Tax=Ceratopteris richardii TaxID=49495 RepID=A0A8T2UPF6_CERRI|nr:hypothetical protein KP509_06G078400 [Ceratopteris richardii]KAH7435756.1 hypothetical protein KP509_06G078400 [Ceratopteris richardii]KAH7435757.1 hypothetical protein KP509_06G078400 [Ceratopteris richardii]